MKNKRLMFLVGFVCLQYGTVYGSGYEPPSKCDDEWRYCRAYSKVRSPEHLKRQMALAEAGNIDSQYFLGVTSSEKEEKERWLKLAIANGSKAAAAYYVAEAYTVDENGVRFLEERWYSTPLTPELHAELLAKIIEAADAGDPHAATWLVVRGRGQHNHCPIDSMDCPLSPLFTRQNVHHWAEIAARGGNMGAAEYLCHVWEVADGLPRDDDKAYYWCSMAAPQSCAIGAKAGLAELYRNKRIPSYAQSVSQDYWAKRYDHDSEQMIKGNFIFRTGACL